MKKSIIIILGIITAMTLFFTACGKDKDTLPDTTTTPLVTTTIPSTTIRNDISDDMSGVPESTSLDSAIGNAAENIIDGAGDVAEDIGDAAERAGDRMNNANERLANDIKDMR